MALRVENCYICEEPISGRYGFIGDDDKKVCLTCKQTLGDGRIAVVRISSKFLVDVVETMLENDDDFRDNLTNDDGTLKLEVLRITKAFKVHNSGMTVGYVELERLLRNFIYKVLER